jgi:hypothetical protein
MIFYLKIIKFKYKMEVKLKINLEWVPALDYQKQAFRKFKHKYWNSDNFNASNYMREGSIDINYNGYKFKIERDRNNQHRGIYIFKENGDKIPITDFNSVKIFLIEQGQWVDARWYQTKAYYDFIYDYEDRKEYNFGSGINFIISRNDNGTIYYQKDDLNRSRVKISDNPGYISAYQAYYNRLTDDIISVPNKRKDIVHGYLPIPLGIDLEDTNIEEQQCVVCFNTKKNIKFKPCDHNHTCSECYLQVLKPRECPFCKQEINEIIRL